MSFARVTRRYNFGLHIRQNDWIEKNILDLLAGMASTTTLQTVARRSLW